MSTPSEKAKSTIVVKRVKKGGHGAHGAAWKIAYADFVTAMMAFFLLMWLLGSTTKGDLKGIQDYFRSPLQISLSGGPGTGSSTTIMTGGGNDLTKEVGQVRKVAADAVRRQRDQMMAAERAKMREFKRHLEQAILANKDLAKFQSQIRIEITPDGLRIQIVDNDKRPMFATGSAHIKSYMQEILQDFGPVLNEFGRKIIITGHTDSSQYLNGDRSYSNWELSSDRANASRRELIGGGMNSALVMRVVGMADSTPLVAKDPMNPLNRRISILILNKMAEARMAKENSEVNEGTASDLRRTVAISPAGNPIKLPTLVAVPPK